MVIKLDVKQILQGRPRMLTRDLFAVADTSCYRLLFTQKIFADELLINERKYGLCLHNSSLKHLNL